MPQKTWVVGEEVLAADFNTYVQNQVVPAFPNVATRDSQWTAPPNGALSVTTDTYTTWLRQAGAWVAFRPGSVLGYAQVTTAQTGIGAGGADLTGLSVAVTVGSSRRIRITAQCVVAQQTANGHMQGYVREGTTNLGRFGTVFMATVGGTGFFHGHAVLTPTAGAHTYKLFGITNTGSYDMVADGTNPASILVEDIGPV
jgi:hypothetical protein